MNDLITWLAAVSSAVLASALLLISGSREGRKAAAPAIAIPALIGVALTIAALLFAHAAGRLSAQAAALDSCGEVCVITLAEGDF